MLYTSTQLNSTEFNNNGSIEVDLIVINYCVLGLLILTNQTVVLQVFNSKVTFPNMYPIASLGAAADYSLCNKCILCYRTPHLQ